MKALLASLVFMGLATARVSASLEQEVDAAMTDLFRHENYSWTRSREEGSHKPDRSPGAWISLPDTRGRTENSGLTEWVTTVAWSGSRKIVGVNRGATRLVDYGDGWMTSEELIRRVRQDNTDNQHQMRVDGVTRRSGPVTPEREQQLYRKTAMYAVRVAHLTPDTVLEAIRGELQAWDRVAGAIWANLTEEGARRLLELVKESNLESSSGIKTGSAHGTAKFWVEDARLAKLQVHIEGRAEPNYQPGRGPLTWELRQIYTFTFADFGKADPRVAREVMEKLAVEEDASNRASR